MIDSNDLNHPCSTHILKRSRCFWSNCLDKLSLLSPLYLESSRCPEEGNVRGHWTLSDVRRSRIWTLRKCVWSRWLLILFRSRGLTHFLCRAVQLVNLHQTSDTIYKVALQLYLLAILSVSFRWTLSPSVDCT